MLNIKIKEIRNELNRSQAEMAELLNVSRSSYAMWESGNDIIPIKRLIQFCEIFDISMNYVLGITGDNYFNNTKFNLEISGERIKQFRISNKLTQEKLAIILNTNKAVICGYEKGRNLIATPFLYTICKEFNVSADYLLGRIEKEN